MPDFKIGEAYIQFGTKGDVAPAAEKQAGAAQRFAQKQAQAQMNWGQRFIDHQKQMNDRMDQFRTAQTRADEAAATDRNMRILKGAAIAKTAFGSIPGVGAASDIAMAGAVGGPAGAAAMATGKYIDYGMQGAAKASPGTQERFQYQQDRLQAIIGSKFVPAIERMTSVFEKASDFMGGKGAQIGNPQFSGFAEARDRMQMLAAQGMPGIERPGGGSTVGDMMRFSTRIVDPFGSTPLGDVAERIGDSVWEGSWAQKQFRGLKRDIFG